MADIPLWPWNRDLHRCLGCGFLSRHWPTDEPASSPNGSTAAADLLPRCYRGAYDLVGEAEALATWDAALDGEEEPPSRDEAARKAERQAAEEVMRRTRRCTAFTPFRPGLSFEAHREMQLRHRDRQWTLLAGSVGAVLGSLLTLAAVAVVLLVS